MPNKENKKSTIMKKNYNVVRPIVHLLGVFALLLSTSATCLCCSSDPVTPDDPTEEGGGKSRA